MELIRRGLWPNTTVDEDRGLNHRPKPKKPEPEVKGAADPTPGPFVKLRLAVTNSVAMAVLSPLARWVLFELLNEYMKPRHRPAEPFLKPLAQLDRCGKRREAIMAALRELETLKLVEITHAVRPAPWRFPSNLYRLTCVGAGCGDAWRALEPDADTPEARREAEARARAEIAAAEAKFAGARTERNRQRRDRRPWVRPAPTPVADEWQDFEPDVDLSEPPDDAEPDFGETPDFGFSPSSGGGTGDRVRGGNY